MCTGCFNILYKSLYLPYRIHVPVLVVVCAVSLQLILLCRLWFAVCFVDGLCDRVHYLGCKEISTSSTSGASWCACFACSECQRTVHAVG